MYSGEKNAWGLKPSWSGAQSDSSSSLNWKRWSFQFCKGLEPARSTLLLRAAALPPPALVQPLIPPQGYPERRNRAAWLAGSGGYRLSCNPGALHPHKLPVRAHSHPTAVCHLRHQGTRGLPAGTCGISATVFLRRSTFEGTVGKH